MRGIEWLCAAAVVAGCGSSDDFSGVAVTPFDGQSDTAGHGIHVVANGGPVAVADVSLVTWPEQAPTGAGFSVDGDPAATEGTALHVDPAFVFAPRWYAVVVKHHGIMGGANATLADGSSYARIYGVSAPVVRSVSKTTASNSLPWLDLIFSEDLAAMPAGDLEAAIVVRQSGIDRGCHLPAGTGPGTTLTASREVPLSCSTWQDGDAITIEFKAQLAAAGGGVVAIGAQTLTLSGHPDGTNQYWYVNPPP